MASLSAYKYYILVKGFIKKMGIKFFFILYT
jgi:hypothetical protein